MAAGALVRAFFAYPWQSVGVVARIHWQALRLWLKHVPSSANLRPRLRRQQDECARLMLPPAELSGARHTRAALAIFRLLEQMSHGSLEIRLPAGGVACFGNGTPLAVLEVRDPAFFDAVLASRRHRLCRKLSGR